MLSIDLPGNRSTLQYPVFLRYTMDRCRNLADFRNLNKSSVAFPGDDFDVPIGIVRCVGLFFPTSRFVPRIPSAAFEEILIGSA